MIILIMFRLFFVCLSQKYQAEIVHNAQLAYMFFGCPYKYPDN